MTWDLVTHTEVKSLKGSLRGKSSVSPWVKIMERKFLSPSRMLITAALLLHSTSLASRGDLTNATTPLAAAFGMSAPPVSMSATRRRVNQSDSFRYLDNGVIRLGIDMSRGGSIGWLGPSSNTSLSLLNHYDFGREVQGSFVSPCAAVLRLSFADAHLITFSPPVLWT